MRTLILSPLVLAAVGCNPSVVGIKLDDTGCTGCSGDTDADTDTDTDTDADSDADTDTGTADPNDVDNDGDGYTENGGDCNDADASVCPGATDTAGDGIDQDCSGADASSSDPYADYTWVDGDSLCFSTDGFNFPYDEAAAYAVGYGTGMDWTLKASHAVSPVDSSDCVDTSAWEYDTYTITLISSLQSDGSLTTSYADTGDWWDNFDFCTSGFPTALSFCTEMEDGNYLVSVSKTTEGLVPAGDGS